MSDELKGMVRLPAWIEKEAVRRNLTKHQIAYKLRFTMEYVSLKIVRHGHAKYVVETS